MRIKEYIEAVTAKIFGIKDKDAVSLELEDHIKCKQEFFEDIGYEDEISEEKAVGEMGDAEDIASYLADLHNDFYNPIFDIIGFIVWALLLIGSFVFLRNIIFNDVTATPICIGYVFIIIAIFFGASAINVKRNRKLPLILSFILGIVTIAISFIANLLISSNGINTISKLKNLMLNGIIPKSSSFDIAKASIISVLLFIAILFVLIFNLILVKKYEKLENTIKTNKAKKAFNRALTIACAIFLITGALFATDVLVIPTKIEEQYMNDYNLVFEIAENCESKEQVLKYLEDNKVDYSNDGNAKISLSARVADIQINFNPDKSGKKNDDPAINLLGKMLIGYLNANYPLTLANRSDYTINFNAQIANNNLGFAKLETAPRALDTLFDFETKEDTTNQEFIDIFGKAHPTSMTINASNNHTVHPTEIEFEYTAGKGDNAFTQSFSEVLKSENAITVANQQKLVIEAITKNPNISNKELAKIAGAKRTAPEISFEDYKKLMLYAGKNYINSKELKSLYNQMYSFEISDDLMFYRLEDKEKSYIVFNSKTKFEYVEIFAYGKKAMKKGDYSSFYAGSFRKTVCYDIGYYDINGNAYKDYMDVAYYSKDGERFRYFEETDDEGKLIEKYFIGSKGNKCIAYDGYVTLDGYFVCGDDTFYKNQNFDNLEIPHYHDKNNVQYIKAQDASWDSQGNLLDFEKYFDSHNY